MHSRHPPPPLTSPSVAFNNPQPALSLVSLRFSESCISGFLPPSLPFFPFFLLLHLDQSPPSLKMMTSTPTHTPSSTEGYQGHLTSGDGLLASRLHRPTHPSLVQVIFNNGSYNSHLISLQSFSPGDLITPFAPHADFASTKSYSTVQTGPNTHIELNSDLLYCNHSCDPNVAFVIGDAKDKQSWKAKALKKIDKGDVLTFCKHPYPNSLLFYN